MVNGLVIDVSSMGSYMTKRGHYFGVNLVVDVNELLQILLDDSKRFWVDKRRVRYIHLYLRNTSLECN